MKRCIEQIKQTGKNTKIHLSQLPPRNDRYNILVKELNKMIKDVPIDGTTVILQEDLTQEHLYDDKHIAKKHLGLYIKNLKAPLRDRFKGHVKNTYREKTRREISIHQRDEQNSARTLFKKDLDIKEIFKVLESSNRILSHLKNFH